MTKKQTISKNEFGYDNIFADLGLDAADELYMHSALGVQVLRLLKAHNYTPRE